MGFKREDIRDTSPLSLKKLNDTIRYLWLHSFGSIDFADLNSTTQGVINNKVSNGDFSSFIEQNPDSVKIAVGTIDELKNSTTEITDEHFRFTNNDGSYVELNPASTGLQWHKGAVSMDYHYLTHVGQATCIEGGLTITLPEEFKNKKFSIIPSIKALSRPSDHPDSQLILFNCFVNSVDYANATAVIFGYSTWNDSVGAYYSYPEISYIAIA